MNMDAVLAGTEPVMKVRLTHLAGAGCILAVTVAHIAAGK